MRSLRNLAWVCVSLGLTGFGFWAVVGPWKPTTNAELGFVLFIFAAQPMGAFWMLYHCIRYEQRPLAFVFLAFVPYSFLWYYFERVRPMEHFRSG